MWFADVSRIDSSDVILIWRLRLRRDFAYREIGIPIALFLWHFQHAILETPTGSRINGPHNPLRWTVLLLLGFVSPLLLALLKIVQVFLDPTVVRPCTQIRRLRSILLFSALFLSTLRSNNHWELWIVDPTITVAALPRLSLRCWSLLLYSSHHRYCTCHQWKAYASCKTWQQGIQ